jgi:hypothetical protein
MVGNMAHYAEAFSVQLASAFCSPLTAWVSPALLGTCDPSWHLFAAKGVLTKNSLACGKTGQAIVECSLNRLASGY